MYTRIEEFEVKSTPENKRYIRHSFTWTYIAKPVLKRCAWAVSAGLALASPIPLAFKCVVNLIDGIFDHNSLTEAGKNFVGIIISPFLATTAGLSAIPLPYFSKIGDGLVKSLMLPIRVLYHWSSGSLKDIIQSKIVSDAKSATLKLPCSVEREFLLSRHRVHPDVRGINPNVSIDTADIPASAPTSRFRIVFNAAAEIYQTDFSKTESENKRFVCNTRRFNYTGITTIDDIESLDDVVNDSAAEIYDLAISQNWTDAQIKKNLHLVGYCYGGGVALQVAAYFKIRHKIDIPVFVYLSFSSINAVATGLISDVIGLPRWYTNLLCRSFLYAAGDYDMDSVAAIKKLNPAYVNYINLPEPTPLPPPTTLFQKLKFFLGIGKHSVGIDSILHEDASLAEGLKKANIVCGTKTSQIFASLNCFDSHICYSPEKYINGHFQPLTRLYMKEQNKNAFDYYVESVTEETEEKATLNPRL